MTFQHFSAVSESRRFSVAKFFVNAQNQFAQMDNNYDLIIE